MDDPLTALVDGLARDGFSPEVDTNHAAITLRHCPFAEAADANPSAICRLHLGLAHGLADTIGGIQVDDLFPADPHSGDCRLTIRTPPRPTASPDARTTPRKSSTGSIDIVAER